MSLSAREISLVAALWERELKGAIVRKVVSPAAQDRIVLELRRGTENHLAQIVISADGARIGRVAEAPAKAAVPHPFVMLLRREATGLAIRRVGQIGEDRAVELELASPRGSGRLICELTARHGNLFWTDAGGIIAGSFHPNRSARRLLVPGAPYVPPIPRPPVAAVDDRFDPAGDLERQVEAFFARQEADGSLEARRAAAARVVRAGVRRLGKLLANLEADRARALQAEELQTRAHLLRANLGRVGRGASSVEVVDFEGRPATVPLDPAASPVENMTRLFERAKRLRRATGRIEERRERAGVDLERFAALLSAVEAAGSEGEIDAILGAVGERYRGLVANALPRRERRLARAPFKEFGIAAGRTARVGRSAADNDALTLRHSRPDDLWLHVRGRKGSHVVVPLGRGEEPTTDVLVDAAHLAARFSDARDDEDVEVTYTRRRYVQKPRGAPPGAVRLLQERTLYLKVDRARLERLLADPQ